VTSRGKRGGQVRPISNRRDHPASTRLAGAKRRNVRESKKQSRGAGGAGKWKEESEEQISKPGSKLGVPIEVAHGEQEGMQEREKNHAQERSKKKDSRESVDRESEKGCLKEGGRHGSALRGGNLPLPVKSKRKL